MQSPKNSIPPSPRFEEKGPGDEEPDDSHLAHPSPCPTLTKTRTQKALASRSASHLVLAHTSRPTPLKLVYRLQTPLWFQLVQHQPRPLPTMRSKARVAQRPSVGARRLLCQAPTLLFSVGARRLLCYWVARKHNYPQVKPVVFESRMPCTLCCGFVQTFWLTPRQPPEGGVTSHAHEATWLFRPPQRH